MINGEDLQYITGESLKVLSSNELKLLKSYFKFIGCSFNVNFERLSWGYGILINGHYVHPVIIPLLQNAYPNSKEITLDEIRKIIQIVPTQS